MENPFPMFLGLINRCKSVSLRFCQAWMDVAVLSWLPSSTIMISYVSGRADIYVCKSSNEPGISASSLYAGMMMERAGGVMIGYRLIVGSFANQISNRYSPARK